MDVGQFRPPTTLDVVDTFAKQNSLKFRMAVILTGAGAGLSAALLYVVLETVQHWAWPASNARCFRRRRRAAHGDTCSSCWAQAC